jgi:hypothetical protein
MKGLSNKWDFMKGGVIVSPTVGFYVGYLQKVSKPSGSGIIPFT